LIQLFLANVLVLHGMSQSMEWLHIAESFSVVFKERLSREQKLCVDNIVLYRYRVNVSCFQLKGSLCVDFDGHVGFSLLECLFVLFPLFSDQSVLR
jgi:hypothetical protein